LRSMRLAVDDLLEAARALTRERILEGFEKELEAGVGKAFKRQGKLYVAALAKHRSAFSEALSGADMNRIANHVEAATDEEMRLVIHSGAKGAYGAGVKAASDMVGNISFSVDHPLAVEWLETHAAEAVTAINETTRDTIANLVTTGLDEGWSYDKTARAISGRYDEFAVGKPQLHIESRAHLVAVTESANAYEEGQRGGMGSIRRAGLEVEMSWSTVGDDRVSDGCIDNELAGWISFDDSFPSGDQHPPRFPGCRCSSRYRVAGSEEK